MVQQRKKSPEASTATMNMETPQPCLVATCMCMSACRACNPCQQRYKTWPEQNTPGPDEDMSQKLLKTLEWYGCSAAHATATEQNPSLGSVANTTIQTQRMCRCQYTVIMLMVAPSASMPTNQPRTIRGNSAASQSHSINASQFVPFATVPTTFFTVHITVHTTHDNCKVKSW